MTDADASGKESNKTAIKKSSPASIIRQEPIAVAKCITKPLFLLISTLQAIVYWLLTQLMDNHWIYRRFSITRMRKKHTIHSCNIKQACS